MTTTFEYRVSPTDPCLVEIRHKHKHAGPPSHWRAYMLRESAEAALRLLEILKGQALQDETQEMEMVRE